MHIWKRLVYLLVLVPFLILALAGTVQAAPSHVVATTGSLRIAGSIQGTVRDLINVKNVSVEGLSDATLLSTQLTNFETNDSAFSCLNGSSLNAWTAPKEFPNDIVIHNGLQGTQCAYGTWIYPDPTPLFACIWGGGWVLVANLPDVTVEGLPDAKLVGTCNDFQTTSSQYSCLNGENINVFTAPKEYPNEYVAHNGLMGNQCTYGVWVFAEPPNVYTGFR
jgi:hypothetical protein